MAERKIENETYRCSPMRATEAIELLADLTRLAGQGAGRLPGILLGLEEKAAGDESGGQLADVATFAAITDVLQSNSSADLRHLVERIVTKAEVKRPSGYAAVHFDEEFTGRLEMIAPVLRFVLEVNYSSFFGESAGTGLLTGLRAAFRIAR